MTTNQLFIVLSRHHTFPFSRPDILALQECPSALEEPLAALLATQPHPLPYRAFMPNPCPG